MARKRLQIDMEGINCLSFCLFCNKSRVQIRSERGTKKVSGKMLKDKGKRIHSRTISNIFSLPLLPIADTDKQSA